MLQGLNMLICLEGAQLIKYEYKSKSTWLKPRNAFAINTFTFHGKAVESLLAIVLLLCLSSNNSESHLLWVISTLIWRATGSLHW